MAPSLPSHVCPSPPERGAAGRSPRDPPAPRGGTQAPGHQRRVDLERRFSVVAPTRMIQPFCSAGSRASCCDLLKRWIFPGVDQGPESPPPGEEVALGVDLVERLGPQAGRCGTAPLLAECLVASPVANLAVAHIWPRRNHLKWKGRTERNGPLQRRGASHAS